MKPMTIGIAAALEYFEWVAQHLQLDLLSSLP
jgi:hypothetical protein